MMRVLGVDPGTTQTGWVLYDPANKLVRGHGIAMNQDFLTALKEQAFSPSYPYFGVFEMIESFGKPVGAEIFQTVLWTGRFLEHCQPWALMYRSEMKMHLCEDRRVKDPNIRRVLMDRFGGDQSIRKGGQLQGIKAHEWSALAVAVTFSELHEGSLMHTF